MLPDSVSPVFVLYNELRFLLSPFYCLADSDEIYSFEHGCAFGEPVQVNFEFALVLCWPSFLIHFETFQMPGRLTHPLFQHIKSRMDSLSMEEFILLNRNIPIDKKVDLPIEMSNNTFHHEDVVAEMHLDDINVMNGATIATNTSELSICEMTASVVNDSLHTRESEGLSVSSLPLLPSEPEVAGSTLNIEPSEMQLERCEHESGSDSKETKLLLEKKPHIASFFPVNVQSGVTQFGRLDHEILTEGQQIKPDLSHREDLYTFYEAPMAKLNGLGALSSGISLHKNGNSSLFKASVVDGEQFLRQQLSHRAGYALALLP